MLSGPDIYPLHEPGTGSRYLLLFLGLWRLMPSGMPMLTPGTPTTQPTALTAFGTCIAHCER
jgi:hypothetical protein